jgi:hypothetical protein
VAGATVGPVAGEIVSIAVSWQVSRMRLKHETGNVCVVSR